MNDNDSTHAQDGATGGEEPRGPEYHGPEGNAAVNPAPADQNQWQAQPQQAYGQDAYAQSGQAGQSSQPGQPGQSDGYTQYPQGQYTQAEQGQYNQPGQPTQPNPYGQPAYGQQQYGQQQYGQPGYGQPQYGQQQYGQQYQGGPAGAPGQYGQYASGYNGGYQQLPYGYQPREKIVAGLLGIFLGSLGVHNFYLGNTTKAVWQLVLTCVGWIVFGLGPVVATVWGLIEGVLILSSNYGSAWHKDARGIELKD